MTVQEFAKEFGKLESVGEKIQKGNYMTDTDINIFLLTEEQRKRYIHLVTKEVNKTLTEDEAKELQELIKLAQD